MAKDDKAYALDARSWEVYRRMEAAYLAGRLTNRPNFGSDRVGRGGRIRRVRGILAETLQAPTCATGPPTTATFWPLYYDDETGRLSRISCETETLYNFDPALTGEKFSYVKAEVLDGVMEAYWVGCAPALDCGDEQCCGDDESCEESSSSTGDSSSSMTSSSGSGSETSNSSGSDTSSGSGSDTGSGTGSDTSSGSGTDTSSGSGTGTDSDSGSSTSNETSGSNTIPDEPPDEPPGLPPEDDPETNSHITPCCTGPSPVGHTLHLSGQEIYSGGPGGSVTGTLEWQFPTTGERLWRGDITFNSGSGAPSNTVEDAEFRCNGAGSFTLFLPEFGTTYFHCGGTCGPPLEVDFCTVEGGAGNTYDVTVSD